MTDDAISPEVLAAHAKVAEGLAALRDASGGCPGCFVRHLEHVHNAVEDLLLDAMEIAEGDDHAGAVH